MNNTQQDHESHEMAEKIVALLNQGAQQIDVGTAAKLLEARKQALAQYTTEQPQPSWRFAWATQSATRMAEPFNHNLRAWVVLLALLTTLAGAMAWQSMNAPDNNDLADIDEGLLTSELPINAYLDRSFDSWLKRPSH